MNRERATSRGLLDVAIWVGLTALFGLIGAYGVENRLPGPMVAGGAGLTLSAFFLLQLYQTSEVFQS